MQRLSKRSKKKLVLESHVQREILLQEMKSRFTAMLILECENLLEEDVLQRHLNKMKEVLECDKDIIEKFKEKNYTPFDSFLLAWGVSTGAMHNHEALCAHTDANKSHPVETLTLYPRVPDTDETYQKKKSNLYPGYLTFPLYGFNIQIDSGFTILHCSLRDTVHLPDHSRSMSNWSKVHGP